MTRLPLPVLPLLLLATAACSTLSTTHDYDPEADFDALESYAWLEEPGVDRANELTLRRAVGHFDAVLAENGFRLDPDAPDFLVAAHVGTEEKVRVVDWGYSYLHRGYYGYGGYGAFGTRDLDVVEYTEGTLILDVVEPESRQLIWRGSASRTVDPGATPAERGARVREAVEAILEPFPPRDD